MKIADASFKQKNYDQDLASYLFKNMADFVVFNNSILNGALKKHFFILFEWEFCCSVLHWNAKKGMDCCWLWPQSLLSNINKLFLNISCLFLSYSYWLPQDQFCQLKWRILICFIVITILQLFSYFFHYMYNKNDSPNILSLLRNDWSKWQIFLKPWSKRNHWFLLKYSTWFLDNE